MSSKSERVQCLATAKSTGRQCRLYVDPSVKYCSHHINNSQTHVYSQTFDPKQFQRGFIYVYTLSHLLSKNPKKQEWLKRDKLGTDTAKPKDPTKLKNFNPKKDILIKVGMTTKTVARRIMEWENQCKHSLVVMEPKERNEAKAKTFWGLFKKLSIKEESPVFNHYQPSGQGFYTNVNLGLIEKDIHSKLRASYGYGDMNCYGCKNKNNSNVEHGIHIEWFLIPRDELENVFKIINTEIAIRQII